ncbi:MAG: zinc-binding dehydrogenase, partial [Gemmatimonadales bacterium]
IVQRRGYYPAPPGWPADIPGIEYAGEVEALGPGATRWRPGARVMGLVGGGAQAEAVVVHQDEALAVPEGISFVEAAAIPEAFLTAYDALVTRGRLRAGERVLIHAAGSGVGTAAIQIARWLGATTLGTSRSGAKLERAKEYGLEHGIDTGAAGAGGFRDAVGDPGHVIRDVLGGAALADNLAVLASRGRLVLLGLLQGGRVEVDLNTIMRKRLEVIGTVMRTRPHGERVLLVREFAERMLPLFSMLPHPQPPLHGVERGPGGEAPLRPVVGATYPMTDLARAHQAMEQNETFGKVVLVWED